MYKLLLSTISLMMRETTIMVLVDGGLLLRLPKPYLLLRVGVLGI
jgi:hypothetical protein